MYPAIDAYVPSVYPPTEERRAMALWTAAPAQPSARVSRMAAVLER